MGDAKMLIFDIARDEQNTFFERALAFAAKTPSEMGLVPSSSLLALMQKGILLSPGQKNALFERDRLGHYAFRPKTKAELAELDEWRILPHDAKETILALLWIPSHLNELSLEEILSQPDRMENAYALVLDAILASRIRFKRGEERFRANPLPKSAKERNRATRFLELVGGMDAQYLLVRRQLLEQTARREVPQTLSNLPDLLAEIPPSSLEIIWAEKQRDDRTQLIEEILRKAMIREMVRYLSDTGRFLWARLFCEGYETDGRSYEHDAYVHGPDIQSLDEVLDSLSSPTLAAIYLEKNPKRKVDLLWQSCRDRIFSDLAPEIQRLLGDETIENFTPQQLGVILNELNAQRQEKDFKPTMPAPSANSLKVFGKKFFAWTGLFTDDVPRLATPKRPFAQEMLGALGKEILPRLGPKKLEILLRSKDEDLLAKTRNGYNLFLPHLRPDLILPLAALYDTPLWEIIRALRFLNHLNLEILDNLESLVEADLIDVPFARCLADTFKRRIELLRLYHIEETQKNTNVITFFKQAFLALKKGIVRIVAQNIDLIKRHREIIPFLFAWKAKRLSYVFSDQAVFDNVLQRIHESSRRRIILEATG